MALAAPSLSLSLARALALPLARSRGQRAPPLSLLPGSYSFHLQLKHSPSQPAGRASLPFRSRLTAQAEKHFCSSSIMALNCRESKEVNPGLYEIPDEATKGYYMQQTMLRVKDPQVSLDFYTRILGMILLKRLDFEAGKFSLYFLGYEAPAARPEDPVERVRWTFQKAATIELTHNWGTESNPEFKGYHNGNKDPRGFGHIGIAVDDTYKACERFEKLGVEFVKKPDEGSMKGLAFIKDPDEYWIEIFDVKRMGDLNT